MEFDFDKLKTQGVKINYYYICKRKLWLFSKGITMEDNSDRVMSGKLVHENSYSREKNKEVTVDDMLKIDIMDHDYIREVKISSKMEEADKMQLLYYLFYLKQLGISKKGILNYVKEKKREEVELTEQIEVQLKDALLDINRIVEGNKPPKLQRLPYCSKCSYFNLCFAGEVED